MRVIGSRGRTGVVEFGKTKGSEKRKMNGEDEWKTFVPCACLSGSAPGCPELIRPFPHRFLRMQCVMLASEEMSVDGSEMT